MTTLATLYLREIEELRIENESLTYKMKSIHKCQCNICESYLFPTQRPNKHKLRRLKGLQTRDFLEQKLSNTGNCTAEACYNCTDSESGLEKEEVFLISNVLYVRRLCVLQ